MYSYAELYRLYKQNKANNSDKFNLKIYRALKWLEKSETLSKDVDMQFITLWIAFNAAYSKSFGIIDWERSFFTDFLIQIEQADLDDELNHLLWDKIPTLMKEFLTKKFINPNFWKYQNGKISEMAYNNRERRHRIKVLELISNKNTKEILLLLFEHLYVLRNQILHGAATYQSSLNRLQLHEGCKLLSVFVPLILHVMLKNPQLDWGDPHYPVVENQL